MKSLFERIDKLDTNLRISSEWAKRKYNEFNTRFFGGRLPKNISFEMSGTTNAVGDASCIVSNMPSPGSVQVGDNFVGKLKIRLSSYFNDITETEAEEVLLHEMIHIWQYVTIPKAQWGANMHGTSFTNKEGAACRQPHAEQERIRRTERVQANVHQGQGQRQQGGRNPFQERNRHEPVCRTVRTHARTWSYWNSSTS